MDLPSVAPLRLTPRAATSADLPELPPSPLSKVGPLQPPKPPRVLAFDFEALATGYADPAWVPQVTTVISYSWLGQKKIHTLAVCDYTPGQMPHIDKAAQREMIRDFLSVYDVADQVSFHNGRRYDQPVLNGMCWWVGLPPISPKPTVDTIDLGRVKGVKKGQDNIGILLDIPVHKMSLNHEQWVEAYAEPGWSRVKQRCSSDVQQHKLIRAEMERRGWLKPARVWRP